MIVDVVLAPLLAVRRHVDAGGDLIFDRFARRALEQRFEIVIAP